MPRQLIRNNRLFLAVFSLYIIVGACSFLFYDKGSETLFLDSHHTAFLDSFFVAMTHMAEIQAMIVIGAILLIWRVKYFLVYFVDVIVLSLSVHGLKHYVFADHPRPSIFFFTKHTLHFVEGTPILVNFSFPSGHTAGAFAIGFLLAIFIRRTSASIVLLGLAMLVGLSRMYLLEHFWIDVYFGSIIGVSVTLLVYIVLQKPVIHNENAILDFSIYERYIKRK